MPLILDSIEEAAKQGTRFVIVDNLTFLCPDAEKSALAAPRSSSGISTRTPQPDKSGEVLAQAKLSE